MLTMRFTCIAILILFISCMGIDADGCNENFTAPTGSIVSAGFPIIPYANNLDCYYTITTPPLTLISIEIKYLDLDSSADYIEIYDGSTIESSLLGHYTGSDDNITISTTQNTAVIYFHTNEVGNADGFYLYYYSEDIPESGCPDEIYASDSGVISSPNYPYVYTANASCVYTINLTVINLPVHLHFDFIDIAESDNCETDYLAIYDGPTSASKLLGKFCGSGPISDIFASSLIVYAVFHSDSDNIYNLGFHITYSAGACTELITITDNFGSISSPGYPYLSYPKDIDCSYLVTTPIGSRVVLRVDYIKTESCSFDYIRIYDGGLDTDPSLGTFCGDKGGAQRYQDIQSSSNQVRIRFVSDYSNTGPGFQLTFSSTYAPQVDGTKHRKKKEDVYMYDEDM